MNRNVDRDPADDLLDSCFEVTAVDPYCAHALETWPVDHAGDLQMIQKTAETRGKPDLHEQEDFERFGCEYFGPEC